MASNLVRVAATGQVGAAGDRILKSVVLHGGSAASSVSVTDSTDGSGTVLLSLAAPIADSAVWTAADPDGVRFGTGIFATLAGTGASASFEIE